MSRKAMAPMSRQAKARPCRAAEQQASRAARRPATARAPRASRVAAAAALALWLACASGASAQDFSPAAPAGPQPGGAALLERALPATGERAALEGAAVRWLSMPDFETRAVAMLVPVRSLRVALGVSQTGDGDLGWTCAALAAGAAADGAGFALRVAARRDREGGALWTSAASRGAGAEAGAGAWASPAPGVAIWAQAPQLWVTGEAPPLARPLELGARAEGATLSAWLAIGAPRAGDDGERVAGVAIARGALGVWAEGRDGPLRGAVGLAADAGPLRVGARIEGHPVLGETTQLVVGLRRGGARRAP